MSTYKRVSSNELVETMGNANTSLVSKWDVLCAYDLAAMNQVLLEEYSKSPVNSKFHFNSTIKFMKYVFHLSCNLDLENPTLAFSTAQSGIYDLEIPINVSSYCNQTMNKMTERVQFPGGYRIVVSGPLGTLKGTDKDAEFLPSDEIIEFGEHDSARVVLHFGNKIRAVSILPEKIPEDYQAMFDELVKNFKRNVKEVVYDLAQIHRNDTGSGLILTPKSFMFTTMANEADKKQGALNIWVQTHQSGNPQGNPQPSFYPDKPVLPVPEGHTSNIIFGHALINERYLKPVLRNYYSVSSVNKVIDNVVHGDSIALVPKDISRKTFHVSFEGIDARDLTYEINYQDNPFVLYAYKDKLYWTWEYETYIKYVETKVLEDMGTGTMFGMIIGGIFGFIFGGPAGAVVGAGLGAAGAAGISAAVAGTVDKIVQLVKLKVKVYKQIDFTAISDTKFSAKFELADKDIDISMHLDSASGFSMYKTQKGTIDWNKMQSRFVPELKKSIYHPTIDFGGLDFFAEANILFNEGRFKMSPDRAIHFPYDTMVIGDIHLPISRRKRHQEITGAVYATSSSAKPSSPINSAINWARNGLEQIKSFVSFNVFRGNPKLQIIDEAALNKTTLTNVDSFDVNSALLLGDFAFRYFTKTKPYNSMETAPSFTDAKAYTLSLVAKFEDTLESISVDNLEFDPLNLMSKIENEVLNGNHNQIAGILQASVFETNSLDKINFQEQIEILLKEHDADFLNTDLMMMENSNDVIIKNNFNPLICQ